MGGIGGQISRSEGYIEERTASHGAMLETLKKRGADESGVYKNGGAVLIGAQTAAEKTGCRQPATVTHGGKTFAIVFNGVIYNARQLRYELNALGHAFATGSDTETLLRAYIQWGGDCVLRLSGMFAFAVWDESERTLFLARDHIGARPLFYTVADGTLIFASDVPSLLAHSDVNAVLDENGVAELLFMGPGRTPGQGILRGIEELEPATRAMFRDGALRKDRYWRLLDRECSDSYSRAVETVRHLVTDAVESQLNTDAPLGSLLSGGLDSSIVTAIASRRLRERGKNLVTFSVSYRDQEKHFESNRFQPENDEKYIKIMGEFLAAEHRDVVLDTPDLVGALFDAADARGLPGMADVDSSLLLLMRAVKPEVGIVLSGEGADELFAGYPWYYNDDLRNYDGFPWAKNMAYRQTFLHPDYAIDADAYAQARYRATIADTHALSGLPAAERRTRELMNLHFNWFMLTLLDRKDRMSQHAGVEARMPFGDLRIAEYLYSLPWDYKYRDATEKSLLREAMLGLLPDEVLWRKKSPYPKTHNPDYLAAVSAMLRGVLAKPDSPVLRIADRAALEGLLTSPPGERWYGQLMTTPQTIAYFLQINYWMERYDVSVV